MPLGRSGPVRAPGTLSIAVAPVARSVWCVLCRITLKSRALVVAVVRLAWKQACVSANEQHCCVHGGRLLTRDCCCPGRSSGRPGDGWGCAVGRRRSAAPRVPHPSSCLAFSHTLGLLLYLSLIIGPVLRNPRLPPWQLLLIYPPPPSLRSAHWHRSQRTGRAGDEGRGLPVAPGTCPGASAELSPGIPASWGMWRFHTVSRLPSGAVAPFSAPRKGSLLWERANPSRGSARRCGAAEINSTWGGCGGREQTRRGWGCWEPVTLLGPGGGCDIQGCGTRTPRAGGGTGRRGASVLA